MPNPSPATTTEPVTLPGWVVADLRAQLARIDAAEDADERHALLNHLAGYLAGTLDLAASGVLAS